MYLVINKCVTAVKDSNFSGHYLRNRSTLDIGVLGYIGILYYKEHPLTYFRLFKYMVPFPRYFTVCITYQPPLVNVAVTSLTISEPSIHR